MYFVKTALKKSCRWDVYFNVQGVGVDKATSVRMFDKQLPI
jgi:hypothetical protein